MFLPYLGMEEYYGTTYSRRDRANTVRQYDRAGPQSGKTRRFYSGLMFADLMIGHHYSISAFCRAASASGVCWSRGTTSCPRSASRFCTTGSANASFAAPLSLAITSFGVPLGAHSAPQTDMWNCGKPASSTVGISGAEARRVPLVMA